MIAFFAGFALGVICGFLAKPLLGRKTRRPEPPLRKFPDYHRSLGWNDPLPKDRSWMDEEGD